jgi:hypothetical protein
MAPSIPLTTKNFYPEEIGFGPVERNKLGGKYVPLTKNGVKARFTIQTPTMSLPFGISAYRERPDAEPSSYSLDVSFRGFDTSDLLMGFFTKIEELNAHLIDSAHTNSVAWFGKQKSKELLEDTYRNLLKKDASGKYAPIMKIKVPIVGGKPMLKVQDSSSSDLTVEDIPKGATAKIICELASVWQVGGTSWGVTFKALKVFIVSVPEINTLEFANDEDDEVNSEDIPDMVDDEADVAMKFL